MAERCGEACATIVAARGLLLAAALAAAGAAASRPSFSHSRPSLISVGTIAREGAPGGAPVGGVSGADYDAAADRWVLISDDKSEFGPARFWIARIDYDIGRALTAQVVDTIILRGEAGSPFAAPGHGSEAADGESIRIDPLGGELLWSTEGDEKDGVGPAVRRITSRGEPIAKLPLPVFFMRDPDHRTGPRSNLSFEGLAFAPDGRSFWLAMEAPTFQDGALASAANGAHVRISRFDRSSTQLQAQLVYHVEPIGPFPSGRLADNGVSEILAIDAHHLLVIERSGIQQPDKDFAFRSRLYCASTKAATDVSRLPALAGGRYRVMRKRLVFDFTTISSKRIGGMEGMAWGRPLSNGHRSLLFVTDNDFSAQRDNQVIALDSGAASLRKFARRNCPG